jgi:hypothetical protein
MKINIDTKKYLYFEEPIRIDAISFIANGYLS